MDQQTPSSYDSNRARALAVNASIIKTAESDAPWRTKLDSLVEIWSQQAHFFSPINLATFIHRYGKCLPPHQSVPEEHEHALTGIDHLISRNAKAFDAQGHVCIACGCVRLRHIDENTAGQLAKAALGGGNNYNATSLSNLVWAHASLRTVDNEFYAQALKLALEKQNEFKRDPRASSNMIWGLAAARPKLAARFVNGLGQSLGELDFNPISLIQVHHARLACGFELPRALKDKIKVAVARVEAIPNQSNEFEREVETELAGLGRSFAKQVPLEGYRVDFVLQDANPKTALELDGAAYHMIKMGGQDECVGSDILRGRVLTALGLRVVQITDREWYSAASKRELLHLKLET